MLSAEELKKIKYTNLNHKTMYSLLFGFGSTKEHLKMAEEKGLQGIAVTDLNTMGGSLDLYSTKKDITGIIGVELQFIEYPFIKNKNYKPKLLTILAMNDKGYSNLCQLTSLASHSDNFYSKPRCPLGELFTHKEGVIVLSGSNRSLIHNAIDTGYYQVKDFLLKAAKDTFFLDALLTKEKEFHPGLDIILKEELTNIITEDVISILKEIKNEIYPEKEVILKLQELFADKVDSFIKVVNILTTNLPEDTANYFKKELDDNYYLEISPRNKIQVWDKFMKTHIDLPSNPQKNYNQILLDISKKQSIKAVITQEVYIPKEDDYLYQCIMMWNAPGNKDGFALSSPQSIMSVEEMYEMVQENYSFIQDEEFIQMCESSEEIRLKCKDLNLEFKPSLPKLDYENHYVNVVPTIINKQLMTELQEINLWNEEIKERIQENKSIQDEEDISEELKSKYKDNTIDYDEMKVREQENEYSEKVLIKMENHFKESEPEFYKILNKSRSDLEVRSALKVIIRNEKLVPRIVDEEKLQELIERKAPGKTKKDFKQSIIDQVVDKNNLLKLDEDPMLLLGNREMRDRLVYEIKTIQYNGILKLVTYFMLIEDISNFHKENKYLYGLGRGSGAGSLFAYGLDVTDVEPLMYDLLFERFLTTERIGEVYTRFPDIEVKITKEYTYEDLVSSLKKCPKDLSEFKETELFFLECNIDELNYYMNLKDSLKKPIKNTQQSTVAYLLGITDEKPYRAILASPTTLPDIDYDTMARDEIKKYLVNKFGVEYVTLMGTFGTLKTKGAIKDVLRQMKPDLSFEEVNGLTSLLNDSGIDDGSLDWFHDNINNIEAFKEFFDENEDIQEAVEGMLGNLKSVGVHAGGIVVAGDKVKEIVSCLFDNKKDMMYITQPDMNHVEWAGLIKYDFLGLKTLNDILNTFKLIEKETGKFLTYADIPKKDPVVYNKFKAGDTMSVFQFNKDWVKNYLRQLNRIESLEDLAIITSILRPGPMEMGMHEEFIELVNDPSLIKYMHPSLEGILSTTYSVYTFQEQIMKTVRELGGLSGNDSVVVLKAMGKKKLDKLVKFKKIFIDNAIKKYPEMQENVVHYVTNNEHVYLQLSFDLDKNPTGDTVKQISENISIPIEEIVEILDGNGKSVKIMEELFNEIEIKKPAMTMYVNVKKESDGYKVLINKLYVPLADKIWMYLEAFAKYGFNKSHAIAYSTISYICMWLKHYYPLEWKTAALTGATKEDFKEFYQEWFDVIDKPDVNTSKMHYVINEERTKTLMPFSFVNGVGDKAVDSIVSKQPFKSFADFYDRVDGRRVNKKCILNLILSGVFDSFFKGKDFYGYRRKLIAEFFELKNKKKKFTSKESLEVEEYLSEIKKWDKSNFLEKEIDLLNITTFDYFKFYKEQMTKGAKKILGGEAIRPEAVEKKKNRDVVIVGGVLKRKTVFPIKNGKSKGEDMMIMNLVNQGDEVSITVFVDELKQDRKYLDELEAGVPFIVKGTVNEYKGKKGIIYKKAWILK
jgi:DNA polymerase III alpha subunit